MKNVDISIDMTVNVTWLNPSENTRVDIVRYYVEQKIEWAICDLKLQIERLIKDKVDRIKAS